MSALPVGLTVVHSAPAPDAAAWERVGELPCTVAVEVPAARMNLGELLGLQVGAVLVTPWPQRQEVPVRANRVTLGWGEFDVVDERIAVRIVRVT